jgi:hypothetical protein
MSAPQATTDTNDICPVCANVLAQNPERPRVWPEKSAGPAAPKPIRDGVTCHQRGERLAADVARVKP